MKTLIWANLYSRPSLEKFISKDQGVSSGGVFISFFQMFLLTKIEIFFQKQTPRENHLATHCFLTFIRVTIYGFIKINKKMRGSKVAFFLQTFDIINKKIAINTDTLINSTDDGLSWRILLTLNKFQKLFLYEGYIHNYHVSQKHLTKSTWNSMLANFLIILVDAFCS